MRYFTKRNFVGREISGYLASKCFLQKHVAKALSEVQLDLERFNLELIIYDCYRPQVAVNHFINWANDTNDIEMKHIFYPDVPKAELFKRGYIASRSGHSKANTVDLGLIIKGSNLQKILNINLRDCRKRISQEEKKVGIIDMGTYYDCFDPLSHTYNSSIHLEALENRKTLVKIMKKHGFKNYSKEWWHFSHINNNYPSTYHNFFVE